MPNRLQKRGAPYAEGNNHAASLDGASRYETLPRATRLPIPIAPTSQQAAVSGALTSHRPASSSFAIAHSGPSDVFIGTAVAYPQYYPATMSQYQTAPIDTTAQRPSSSRSSVDVRRLDGTPYPAGEKQVKVARDMHGGAIPPAYKGQQVVDASQQHSPDGKPCSKPDCTKCGRRKIITPEQSSSPDSRAPAHYSRPMSQGSTIAGPSSTPTGPPLRKCHQCGKPKKPASMMAPMPPQPAFGAQHRFSSQSTIATPAPRPQQPVLSILAGDNLPQPPVPQVDIIPPSASTYRPVHSIYSNYSDDAVLMRPTTRPASQQNFSSYSPSSLIRSLSRKASSKSRSGPPTPGSEAGELASGGSGGGSGGGFMGLIRGQSTKDYTKLNAGEQGNSRPTSPFSFQEVANDDAFELRPMTGKEKDIGSPGSNGSSRDSSSLKSPPARTSHEVRSAQSRPEMHYRSESLQPDMDLMHAIPEQGGQDRPQLTRFKSLRSGVSRAASNVSRSSSLKRLGSMSKHWYRDDMSIDAHGNGEGEGEGHMGSAY
jgi:hypothetical protein